MYLLKVRPKGRPEEMRSFDSLGELEIGFQEIQADSSLRLTGVTCGGEFGEMPSDEAMERMQAMMDSISPSDPKRN